MPFIRYQMNDTARVNAGERKCKCGRGLPLSVEDFEGRADDILTTADGRYLPGVNFYTMMYKTPGVKMFQIMQQAPDSVEVMVVPTDAFDMASMQLLRKGLTDRLGSVNLEIKLVNEIERSRKTGKIRCIINNCKAGVQ
jgi:phenylacetate-CoA ligase